MEELEALRQEYAKELPGRLSEIFKTWHSYQESEDSKQLEKFQHLVHKLAGSGAVYGFTLLSDASHDLDTLLLNFIRSGTSVNGEGQKRIGALLNQMRQSLEK